MSASPSARRVREFQPAYVLNLLRTPAYAAAARATTGPVDRDRERIDAANRSAMLADTTCSYEMVMTEAALRWTLGSHEIVAEQRRHVLAVAELPHVDIGVIALDTLVDVVIGHAFHIHDDRSVTVGTFHGSTTIVAEEQVAAYVELFGRLRSLAVRGPALKDLLRPQGLVPG